MFESIMALVGMAVTGWVGILVLWLVAITAEQFDSSKFATLLFVVAIFALFSNYSIPVTLASVLIGGLIYIIVGMVWSIIRYKKLVNDTLKQNATSNKVNQRYAMKSIAPSHVVDRIVSWIIIWPVSMVSCLTSVVFDGIRELVTNVLSGIYKRTHESALVHIEESIPKDGDR